MDRNLIDLRRVLLRHWSGYIKLSQELNSEYCEGQVAAFQTAIGELDKILLSEYRSISKGDESE